MVSSDPVSKCLKFDLQRKCAEKLLVLLLGILLSISCWEAYQDTQAIAYWLVDQSETLPCLLTGGIYARLNKAIRKETNEFGYSFSSIGFDISNKQKYWSKHMLTGVNCIVNRCHKPQNRNPTHLQRIPICCSYIANLASSSTFLSI